MRPLPAPFALALLASLGAASGALDLELERRLAEGISAEQAARDVRTLVAFGPRMGGTPSGDAAAAWLAGELSAAGLEVEVLEDGERWCHSEERWSVTAHVEGEDEPFELASAWPYGFSPSASGRARLATSATEGGAWLTASATRAPRGAPAPAVILQSGASTEDGRYAKVRGLRAGTGNPTPVFGLGSLDAQRLAAWLAEGRAVEVAFELESRIAKARPKTVVATLRGASDAPPGHLLYCAHGDSDSGGPGANDNGSGEAVVLAIARGWSAALREGTLAPPARTVRFALWGSEIASSGDYRDARAAAGDPILAVVNFDQAGFGSGAEQLNLEPDDLPANGPFVQLFAALLRDHAGRPGFPEQWATNKSLGGTDSYVFSGAESFRRNARPAVTLFTSAWDSPAEHPRTPGSPGESWRERDLVRVDHDVYYHSSGDRPENTTDREPHNMAWCARVGWLVGLRWLSSLEG